MNSIEEHTSTGANGRDMTLLEQLQRRDVVEGNYRELFQELSPLGDGGSEDSSVTNNSLLDEYREVLKQKDKEMARLQEIISVMNKNNERLNDEIISANIENNVLEDKFKVLSEEHSQLVQRWLAKVQLDADTMNATIESRGSR